MFLESSSNAEVFSEMEREIKELIEQHLGTKVIWEGKNIRRMNWYSLCHEKQ